MALTINGTTGIETNTDTGKLKFGTGDDLEIYHDGTESFIHNNTDDLNIEGDSIKIRAHNGEAYIVCAANGAVGLRHDNNEKLATTSGGIEVTGGINLSTNLSLVDSGIIKLGTGDDLQIKHDGTNNIIHASNGYIQHRASAHFFNDEASSINFIRLENSAAKLCYGGNTKLETTSAGGTLTGNWAGKVGLQNAQQWRVNSNFTMDTSGAIITSNWEAVDTDGGDSIGSSMSESSGVFTFPSTGKYWIVSHWNSQMSSGQYQGFEVQVSTDSGSSYNMRMENYDSTGGTGHFSSIASACVIDVTNASTFRFKFRFVSSTPCTVEGNTNTQRSGFTILRLGDT